MIAEWRCKSLILRSRKESAKCLKSLAEWFAAERGMYYIHNPPLRGTRRWRAPRNRYARLGARRADMRHDRDNHQQGAASHEHI